ncbi:MAG TPA: response regulator [Gemmatimonadales bacterium]|nr:response regulator [Gemmatimonadales bacterium]
MTAPVCLALNADTPDERSWMPEPHEQGGSGQDAATARILVVDDEMIVRNWIARLLQEQGYVVEIATDGAEALRIARDSPQGFDLVVTDVRMPQMDGWQLGRRVREHWPGLPVLYVSGYDVHQSAPGPHAFLRKPFESDDLLRRVAELLRDRT